MREKIIVLAREPINENSGKVVSNKILECYNFFKLIYKYILLYKNVI